MSCFLPNSIEEIQSWVNSRIIAKQAFSICGKGSRFVNSISRKAEHDFSGIISLQKLNSKRFFDPEDMVISIESGMDITTMQEILTKKNMILPVNPWFAESCVGSVVACNDVGPNRMNMGGLRDFIIGIEYINGKGEIVTAGGKVVKNVSGYDLTRMLLGSQGGLGIITAVTFKVLPQPSNACGMFEIYAKGNWLSKIKEVQERKIPLDWVQAFSLLDSCWILGMGYSGNEPNRKRIEKEIINIFGKTLKKLSDCESISGVKFTPGENRFFGFLPKIIDSWEMEDSYFHVFVTLPTEKMLSLPLDFFLKENFKIIIHPIGGDIHFIHSSTLHQEQLKLLEKIKYFLVPDGKIKWVRGSSKSSLEDLGKFGVANSYSLTKKLKFHLDPARVFYAPYYEMDI